MRRIAPAAAVMLIGTALAVSTTAAVAGDQARGRICKRGQATVTIRGKKSCRPLGAALPRPRKGDQRLELVASTVTLDMSALHDTSGRQVPSPAALYGAFGPAVYATVQRAIPEALSRLSRLSTVRWARSAACPPPGGPTRSDSFRQDAGGGATVTTTVNLGSRATVTFSVEKDGERLSLDLDLGLCEDSEGFEAPACPTAAGVLDGTYGANIQATTTRRDKSGFVTYSVSTRKRQQTRFNGQVGEDAKLVYLDVQDTVTYQISGGGSTVGTFAMTATAKRRVRVDGRSGAYDRGRASFLDVSSFVNGVRNNQADLAEVTRKLEQDSSEVFARTVARAIAEYRSREKAWNRPNTCATLRFSPMSRTLTLKSGQSGRVTGRVQAKRGGTALGRWRLVASQNARFSPPAARGAAPTFLYHVTGGGRNAAVTGTFRATSRAGVALESWKQGTTLPRRWRGEGSYHYTLQASSNREEGDVTATLTLSVAKGRTFEYLADGGTIRWTASGSDSAGCTWRSSGSRAVTQYDLFLQLDTSRSPPRASFSAQDSMTVPGTLACPWRTYQTEVEVGHPFFLLSRLTEGVPVDAGLTTIKGSRSGSRGGPGPSETWRFDWNFTAAR